MDPVRVMIVDDSRTQRIILRRQLENAGGAEVVAEAADGQEALTMYQVHRPDIVLLDVVMPVMDGRTALQRIVAMDSRANVVMVSSMGTTGILEECLAMGASSFLQKPFETEALARVLCKGSAGLSA